MQRTKSKILSILLSLVMLLSLLPTTALAAYPDASNVYVDGGKNFYNPGRLYYKNDDPADSFTGTSTDFNAAYDPDTGTLTLRDYKGGSITAGGNKESKITVVLVGDNFINDGNLNSPYGGDITVTSGSSGGTLTITNTLNNSNAAIGIGAGYGNYETGSVTITGSADVKIEVTHNGESGYEKAYGIFAKENITISEDASVDITCATPNNTTGGGNCNGLRADKNVTIDTNGTIKIDVKNAGRDENNGYSYGVYPMGTATLTKVGNMEVQWKKDANNTSYSGGAFTRGATFSETDHAINEDTTNCYASYRKGTPRKVTVQDGQLTGPGVPNARVSGSFLQGDKVNITPDPKKSWNDQEIPFKEWTSSDVTLDKSATTASNSFTVPVKDVTVTAKHSPFVGTPTFTPTGTTNTEGTLTFKTLVKADAAYEGFRLVKDGEQNDESKYISFRPDNSPSTSPYEYSYETNRVSGVNQVDEGNYYVVAYLNNDYYLSEKFTVDYTAAPVPSAAVSDVTIDGTTGTAIANKDVVITLTNDTFASSLSGDWITNLPAGLSQSVSRTDDTHAKITVSGTPTATSSDALVIKIPAANLVTSTSDLDVTSNANAKFAITAPATPITDTLVPVTDLTGKTYNESAQEPTFGGGLTRGTDYTVSYEVKSGSTGTLNSDGKPVGAGTYVVTVAGKGSYTGSFTKDFKIDKADPVYTAPTAKTSLTYTGSAQALITAGSVSKGGEMQYNLNSGAYSTTIPTATDAGDYTVHFKIVENNNYNAVAETQVGSGAINIAQAEWGIPAETLTPVNPTTAGGSDGQITGTTSTMQYKKSDGTWTDCTGNVTGLTAGTYYVRYKADGNHTASDTNYKTVTLTDPGATLYGVTVTDGTAAPTGDQAAGTEVTITANTKTGFNFKEWTGLADSDYKTGSTKTSNPATFVMPASAVNVTATYEAAALTGTASITGTEKFGQTLTANTTGITNNTGTFSYQWKRDGADITSATNSTYTLVEDDIGKTITVAITSNVQTGEITGSTTGTIDKADGPAAPSVTPVACTNSSNNDGKITGVNTTMEYQKSGAATWTACSGTEVTGLTNGTYYVRVAETTTHKAGAAANVTVPANTPGALGGSASISGTAKYDEVLTAVTSSITGNTGTFSYQWKRNGTDITSATNSTYKLVEDDIGKTITVAITSSVESGTIVSSPTATVDKADGPAAPSAFTLSFTLNSDGTTYTATIPTVAGGEYSFDGTNYSATNSKADCAANTGYTGYVRIAETSTHKASTATSSMQTSPKLTVATPTFTPNGASGFTGTQSVTISCTTAGAKIYYTTDGTNPTVSSTLYTTTLSLTSTTTVKAIAVNAGMNDSAIATATFTKYSGGSGGGGGSYTPSYTVSVDKTEGGTITVSPKSASKGTTVTLTVEPDKGYTLETITVTDKNGDEIALTNKGDGKYTFKMPAGKVYVEATFMEDNSMLNFFVDVPADAYYYDAVLWAAKNGITGGVDAAHFAPNATCTRAQVVTFLWRAAGSPAPKNSMMPFTDVPAGSYYEQAVLWAVENGMTGGTDAEHFSPNATCTRAQIVTFLWRSQKSPDSDSVNPFTDVAADAYYNSAVLWAAENGITGGTTATTFSPNNDCTRAQIVTFLYRCLG